MPITDHETPGTKATDEGAPYHDVLAEMLAECAASLKGNSKEELADASPARELQDKLGEIVASTNTPPDIQFISFLLDVTISDAFRNFFGDLVYSEDADRARRDLCARMALLFDDLSMALRKQDSLAQFTACRAYITDYLAVVRELNAQWQSKQDERTHHGGRS